MVLVRATIAGLAPCLEMTDLFPTLCELAGAPVPVGTPIDGISFANRLLRGALSSRQWVTGGIQKHVTLFDGNWRLDSERTHPDRQPKSA